jgi:hypothetical protein
MFKIKDVVENLETHFKFNKFVFVFENRVVCEIMKNIVERGRPQATLWCLRIAFWLSKATNTHSGYVIFIVFPLQQWLHERASLLCYTYTVCLVYLFACLCPM